MYSTILFNISGRTSGTRMLITSRLPTESFSKNLQKSLAKAGKELKFRIGEQAVRHLNYRLRPLK